MFVGSYFGIRWILFRARKLAPTTSPRGDGERGLYLRVRLAPNTWPHKSAAAIQHNNTTQQSSYFPAPAFDVVALDCRQNPLAADFRHFHTAVGLLLVHASRMPLRTRNDLNVCTIGRTPLPMVHTYEPLRAP